MLERVSHDCLPSSAASPSQQVLADVIDRIAARLCSGERIDFEHEANQYSEFADELRLLLPTLEALALAGGSQRDASAGPAGRCPGRNSSTAELGPETPIEAFRETVRAPKSLGEFQLVREVGRGGMGIVYEARQVSLSRRVAVKVLPAASLLDERQLQRFQNEARAAAQLNHPHIVDVICVGFHEGVHYFAMRFIDGRTLAEVIDDCKMQIANCKLQIDASGSTLGAEELTPHPARRDYIENRKCALWIAQAAEALDHAHALGVVHRDVKPSNLLVDGDGKLWVTDFGVARFGDDAGLTLTGDFLGTLRYMSPEQALGRFSAIGPRSDVYSLGATLYELLAARPVFAGDDRGELLRQVAFERPMSLRSLDPRLPRDLETIALKALEKSPDDRYATAGEMARDLRRYLRGEPILAKPPTLAERTLKWSVRNSRLLAAAVVLLLLALAGLLTSTLLIARSRDDAVAAQKLAEQRDRDNRRMLSIMETSLAMQAYQQADFDGAKKLLDRAAPSAENGTPSGPRAIQNPKSKIQNPSDDFRTFAWHWLRQAVDFRCAELKCFGGHPSDVYEVEYSPDGKLLAAACGHRHIILRDTQKNEVRHDITAHNSDVNSLDFSPDGTLLASVGDDRRVRLWHVATGELAADVGEHDCQISSVAFSPDGRRLATGDEKGLIIVWDVPSRREEKRLVKHTNRIRKLDFAADGTLVNISADWYLTAWDVDAAEPRWRLTAPHARFNSVALSPDGKTVAAGDGLGIIFLIDSADGRVLGRLGEGLRRGAIDGLAFSLDGRLLAAGGDDNHIQFWDLARQTCLGQTPAHDDRVWSIAISPDGRTLAAGTRDRVVKLWEVESFCRFRQLTTRHEEIGVAFSDDNTLAVASNDDLWIWPRGAPRPRKLSWPAETGFAPSKREEGGPIHRGGAFVPYSVAWFGKELVLQDTAAALWRAAPDGGCRRWIERHGQPAKRYSLSRDGRWMAILTTQDVTEIWNTGSRELIGQPSKRGSLPQFSPDSRCFYTCRDARLLRWPLPSADAAAASPSGAAAIAEPEEVLRLDGDLDPVAISADGRTLLLGHVQLLDLPTLRLTPLAGHETAINCAAFSPDGRTLAMGKMDGTTSGWDVATGQKICTLDRRPDGEIRAIAFSPDGKSLAAAGRERAGGSVTLWKIK